MPSIYATGERGTKRKKDRKRVGYKWHALKSKLLWFVDERFIYLD